MTDIREAELPGLGKKYQLNLENGEQIAVIIHDDGTRDLYYFAGDDDDPVAAVSLTDQESRQLGSIIGGAFYKPRRLDRLDTAISGLRIEWLKVGARSEIAGKSIGDMGLRKNHGIIVIAVMEDKGGGLKEVVQINPGPGYVFQPGHTIIAAGRGDKMKAFEKMFEGAGS
ncbi:MAG: cation:proton antiporter regulatory subunit [Armatimonadetes bacterium]|nr:cation:proton antiporter regulatory subunit [Armatimonadota bacterium]